MANNICRKFVRLVLSLFLLWLKFTSASTPLGHRLLCIDMERHALLRFKANIHQDPYGSLSAWTREQEATNDCCNWKGITCNNHTGHVTSIILPDAQFQGKISPSLLNLSYLNHLDLSSNYFDGNFPSFITSLTRLRYLDLSFNSFNGTIPMSISSLTKLRYLHLSGNSFHGAIPMSISSLTKLRYLYLSFNSFNGTIPMSISSLTRLKYLYLNDNSFNGTIPSSISSLTQLRYLDLSSNSFHGTIPPEIGNVTNLQHLSLGNLQGCTIENLDWLSRLSHLEVLDMSGISFAEASNWINVTMSLHKLSSLSLHGSDLSQVTHPYSSYVNSSPSSSISYLNLGNNNLNSSMYHWLFHLTSNRLVDLDLSGNKLDGIPRYLGNLCGLTSLDFCNNSAAFKFSDFLYNLSGCTSNSLQTLTAYDSQFTGSLSDDIQKFTSLKYLLLFNNLLNGTVSEKVWELPKLQYLYVSSNSLKGAITENFGKSKLLSLDFSGNSIERFPSEPHMSNLSYINYISLRSCKLGAGFLKWIQTLKNLTSLDIANAGISDAIPVKFWNMWPSQLHDLDLSSNNITGKVTDLLSNFDSEYSNINLSSNNFYGSIEHVSSSLSQLDLSRNKFYGEISFLCKIVDGSLVFLDLTQNLFTGRIPDCLWHFKELRVLNLGQNNMSGKLPSSVEYLISLEVLDLYNNNLSGELPLSLKNCTMLTFLELKGNKFSGHVPDWIGENLSGLYVLSLTSSNFFGTIPLQLCHLVNLQILDLSMNSLSGTIPSCLNNLTAMVQRAFLDIRNVHNFPLNNGYMNAFVDYEMVNWQGSVREFSSTLGMVKRIDLSSNILTGNIPCELTDLHELIALNLSMNALNGEIPPNIGLLKNLLNLDLSINNLSGQIPTSMSEMSSLDYLDVSCNKLSGRIPSGTQLQSFDSSRYTGNEGLCGPPLTKYCPGDKELEMPHDRGQSKGGGEGVDELERWFYIGGATGFATGFWITCGALLVNRRGRNAFFHYFDSMKDWVYVKVMVLVLKWQRGADA